jgi:hypothetical protein
MINPILLMAFFVTFFSFGTFSRVMADNVTTGTLCKKFNWQYLGGKK